MERIWDGRLPDFSSTKAFTGHTTSASGAIEAVICLLTIERGFLPRNLGWKNPITHAGIPVIDKISADGVNNVINNSFGFGGNDSTLVFSKYEEYDS